MHKQCQKCRKKVSDELFICPHCGAILGEPVRKALPAAKVHKERKTRRSISLPWLGPVLMIFVIVSMALILPKYLKDLTQTTPTDPTKQTVGPMVTYSVQVKVSNRSTLQGVLIEIYLGDRMIDCCVTGLNGKASFTLPEGDDYRLKLCDLPVEYRMNYGDSYFPIPEGQQDFVIALEDKPVSYVVKVVNQAGEPLPGTCLYFHKDSGAVTGVTDENGSCTFEAPYRVIGYGVTFKYLTTGYVTDGREYRFDEESNELVIPLTAIEDTVSDGEEVYTLRVVDEYGQPVSDTMVFAVADDPYAPITGSYVTVSNGILNLDGQFVFVGEKDWKYSISLPQLPDYSEALFSFEEGSNELLIELDLEREEYTYTVYVLDQHGEPYPGFKIFCEGPSGMSLEDICYVSDENGVITFTSSESDPTKVVLYTLDVTNGWIDRRVYHFQYNTRKQTVNVYDPEKAFVYTVEILDQNQQPVVGAVVELIDSKGETYHAESDQDGLYMFFVDHIDEYLAVLRHLPAGYTGDLDAPRQFSINAREILWTVTAASELSQ